MIWILMVLVGGSTSQSGVAIDMHQEFVEEAQCIEVRDQIRAIEQAKVDMKYSNYRRTEAHCLSRSERFPGHGKR